MNLIEIGPVIIEIRGFENCKLVVPVNNTLVHHMVSWPLTYEHVS